MRRTPLIATVGMAICVLGRLAAADGDATWDGSYEHLSGGGNELCPDSSETVVVSGGNFSIPWNIKLQSKLFHVGLIAGSVRASGYAKFKATLLDPLPAGVIAALRAVDDSPEQLEKIASEMRLTFVARQKRNIQLSSGVCYAGWDAPAGAAGPVTARDKPRPAKPAKAIKLAAAARGRLGQVGRDVCAHLALQAGLAVSRIAHEARGQDRPVLDSVERGRRRRARARLRRGGARADRRLDRGERHRRASHVVLRP
jgi:hypothetical protein